MGDQRAPESKRARRGAQRGDHLDVGEGAEAPALALALLPACPEPQRGDGSGCSPLAADLEMDGNAANGPSSAAAEVEETAQKAAEREAKNAKRRAADKARRDRQKLGAAAAAKMVDVGNGAAADAPAAPGVQPRGRGKRRLPGPAAREVEGAGVESGTRGAEMVPSGPGFLPVTEELRRELVRLYVIIGALSVHFFSIIIRNSELIDSSHLLESLSAQAAIQSKRGRTTDGGAQSGTKKTQNENMVARYYRQTGAKVRLLFPPLLVLFNCAH